jgi:CheY-like chemotaxis protein
MYKYFCTEIKDKSRHELEDLDAELREKYDRLKISQSFVDVRDIGNDLNELGSKMNMESIKMMGKGMVNYGYLFRCKRFLYKRLFKRYIGAIDSKLKEVADEIEENDLVLLIVDDNVVNLKILEHMITFINTLYTRVETSTDGNNAFEFVKNNQNCKICILLDLIMPNINGIELITKLNEFKNIYIIVQTVLYDDVETMRECLKSGAKDFLKKPIEQDVLKTALDKSLKYFELQG